MQIRVQHVEFDGSLTAPNGTFLRLARREFWLERMPQRPQSGRRFETWREQGRFPSFHVYALGWHLLCNPVNP